MTDHEHAEDFYALVGTITGHEVHMAEAKATELAQVIIDAGFRWSERN